MWIIKFSRNEPGFHIPCPTDVYCDSPSAQQMTEFGPIIQR